MSKTKQFPFDKQLLQFKNREGPQAIIICLFTKLVVLFEKCFKRKSKQKSEAFDLRKFSKIGHYINAIIII